MLDGTVNLDGDRAVFVFDDLDSLLHLSPLEEGQECKFALLASCRYPPEGGARAASFFSSASCSFSSRAGT